MPRITNRSALTKKAQVTIPKKIRNFLGLETGDIVEFVLEENEVKILPVHSDLEKNFGKVVPREKPEDFNAVRSFTEEQIAQEVVNEVH